MLPMTVFFCLLSRPIVRVIFQRGAFDRYSAIITSDALFFFSLGLMAYGGVKILVAAFHALQDTRTPVKVAVLALIVNTVLNVLLMFPMKIAGIALASSVASFVNLIVLSILIGKKVGVSFLCLKGFLVRIMIAGLGQALAVWALWRGLSVVPEIGRLAIVLAAGGTVYWLIALALRMEQPRAVMQALWGRSRG
jgi:putative peptidoglycan lipid II flippase